MGSSLNIPIDRRGKGTVERYVQTLSLFRVSMDFYLGESC